MGVAAGEEAGATVSAWRLAFAGGCTAAACCTAALSSCGRIVGARGGTNSAVEEAGAAEIPGDSTAAGVDEDDAATDTEDAAGAVADDGPARGFDVGLVCGTRGGGMSGRGALRDGAASEGSIGRFREGGTPAADSANKP